MRIYSIIFLLGYSVILLSAERKVKFNFDDDAKTDLLTPLIGDRNQQLDFDSLNFDVYSDCGSKIQQPEMLELYNEYVNSEENSSDINLVDEYKRRLNRTLSSGLLDPNRMIDAESWYGNVLLQFYFVRDILVRDYDNRRHENYLRYLKLFRSIAVQMVYIEWKRFELELAKPEDDLFKLFSYFAEQQTIEQLQNKQDNRIVLLAKLHKKVDTSQEEDKQSIFNDIKDQKNNLQIITSAIAYQKNSALSISDESDEKNRLWKLQKRYWNFANLYQLVLLRFDYSYFDETLVLKKHPSLHEIRSILQECCLDNNRKSLEYAQQLCDLQKSLTLDQ